MNLARNLVKAARAMPNKTAVRCGGREISFRILDIQSNRLANAFRDLGIEPKDRCLVMMPDSIDRVVVSYALAKAGMVEVSVDCISSGRLLRHAVVETKPKIFIGAEPYLEEPRKVFSGMEGPSLRFALEVAKESEFIELGAAYSNRPEFPLHPVKGDDMACIVYTESGKAVMVTHESLVEMCEDLAGIQGVSEPGTVVIGAVPLHRVHGFGIVLNGSVCRGQTVQLCQGPEVKEITTLVERERQTMLYAIPEVFSRLIKSVQERPLRRKSLRFCMVCDGSVSLEDNRLFEEFFGLRIVEVSDLRELTAGGSGTGDPGKPGK